MDKRYVVLSIDGGGVRGIMYLEILAYIEEELSKKLGRDVKVTDVVDFVIGSSAGGLTALCLAYGMSARAQRDSVEDMQKNFFDPKLKRGKLDRLRKSAFDNAGLESQIIKYMDGDKTTMGDLRKKNPHIRAAALVIEYDGKGEQGKFTPRVIDSDNPEDADKTLLEVAKATAAAPTYFDGVRMNDGKLYHDGAIFACNPSAWGIVLA